MGAIAALARVLYVLLLGVWAGAGAYHLLVIVPSALAAFPDKHGALAYLQAAVGELDRFGTIAGPLVVVLLLVGWLGQGRPLALRVLGAVALGVAAVSSRLWLGPQIVALEAQLLEGAQVTATLNELYTAADGLLIGTVVLALLLLVTTPLGGGPRPGSRIQLGVRL